MNSPGRNSKNVTRERIIRQTPRPRLSLSSLPRREHNDLSLESCDGMNDGVKVKNRFQHSQNNVLSYSNSTYSSQNANMLQNSNSTHTGSHVIHPHPGQKYTATVVPSNYSALPVDKFSSRFDNICSRCHASAIVYDGNIKKCHNCGQFSLLKGPHINTPSHADQWYNVNTSTPRKHLPDGDFCTNSPWKNESNVQKRAKSTRKPVKSRNKSKICLTISSDEEEDRKSQKDLRKPNSEANLEGEDRSKAFNDTMDESKEDKLYRIPKLSDRMKLQGGREGDNPLHDSPGLAIVRPSYLATTERGFELRVWHVQLGNLTGKGKTPLILQSNILKIEVECCFDIIEDKKKKRMSERYKLALSSVEVSKIVVNYDTDFFLISIVPSKRYSDIINKALSKCIIDAESEKPIEQQIIFIVDSTKEVFKQTLERTLPHLQRIAPVSTQLSDGINNVLSSIKGEDKQHRVTRSSTVAAENAQALQDLKTIFIYPPPPKKGGIALKNVDVDCLLPGVYLNDIIIDFYLRYLYEEILTEEQRAKTYIFNSYFYTCLSKRAFGDSRRNETPMERMHSQVRKWTRDIDIFERDFIIIPINEHSHWFLVIICFPARVELDETTDFNESVEGAGSDDTDEVVAESKKSEEGRMDERKSSRTERNSGLIDEKCEVVDSIQLMDVDIDSTVIDEKTNDKDLQEEELKLLRNNQVEEDGKDICNKPNGTDHNSVSDDKSQTIVFEQPCILLFDSLVSGGRSRVFSNLRHYLTMEWKEKRKGLGPEKTFTRNNLKGCFPKIPLQHNDCDCGIYILQFVESFFQQPILNYKFPIKKKDWFTKAHVDSKRETIIKIINDLEQKFIASN